GALTVAQREAELLHCCGSRAWARAVAERAPYSGKTALLQAAETAFDALSPEDWLEAFGAHPRIGDRQALGAGATPGREQAGVQGAAATTLERLAQGNRTYEDRFGHVYLVCATGKTAEEMLAILESRLENDAKTELRNAAAEQRKITDL